MASLIDFDREQAYLRRERYYISSTGPRTTDVDGNRFHVIQELPKRVQYIQALEVTDFNVPKGITPTFFEKTSFSRGNNLLDVWIAQDDGAGGYQNERTFTVELTPDVEYSPTNPATATPEMTNMLKAKLDAGLAALADPNYASVVFTVDLFVTFLAPASAVFENIARIAVTADYNPSAPPTLYVRFLFGTGPSAGNAPERVLGFEQGKDTVLWPPTAPSPYTNLADQYRDLALIGPFSTRMMQYSPLRYVDVNVREVEPGLGSNVPVARIFTERKSTFFVSNYLSNYGFVAHRPRILTTPIPYADRLEVSLEMENGAPPSASAPVGWDVVFDLMLVSPEMVLPRWLRTALTL